LKKEEIGEDNGGEEKEAWFGTFEEGKKMEETKRGTQL